MMKRVMTYFLVISMMVMTLHGAYGAIDDSILTDTVSKTYVPRQEAIDIIKNITFSDVADDHWAKEAIVRLGAINVIKGYNEENAKQYRPEAPVSNEETLALILRVLGLEERAQQASANLAADPSTPEHVLRMWTKGYLQVANQLGLISNSDLTDALAEDQSSLVEGENFFRGQPATREQVAEWIVKGINSQRPDLIEPLYTQQAVFGYRDWEDITNDKIPYVEAVITNKIMIGNGIDFNPQESVTRAQIAQTLKNADEILYDSMNVDRKNGYIAHIEDSSQIEAGKNSAKRTLLIRTEDGLVEKIEYTYNASPINTIFREDVPVYAKGKVEGLLSLMEGDNIEYLAAKDTNEMLYIYNKGAASDLIVHGTIQPISDLSKGLITVKDDKDVTYTFNLIKGLYDTTNNTLKIDGIDTNINNLPLDKVQLTVKGGLVVDIEEIGIKIVGDELSGLVKENNLVFNYLTIITWDGKEITKYYNDKVEVEKQNFYDDEDEIGYYDELFPDFRYDERDTSIGSVEAGDIVHLKLMSNSDYISRISAKTNYTIVYGTVKYIVNNGAAGFKIMVEHDDKTNSLYDVESTIPIIKDGKNISQEMIKAGDVIKLLVNQAVIEPGRISETVKSIRIDDYGNTVTSIYRGQLGTINDYQRTMTLLNSYELSKLGWTEYEKARVLDLSNPNIEFYKDDQQISLSYANQFLKSDDIEVYVAMEKYYDNEKVIKVSFRDGRDAVLGYNNITYANGSDRFKVLQNANFINMGIGTIVVKDGKLVETNNVVAPDYAQVVLNGNYRAAVVNVEPEPNNDGIFLYRVRIASIDDNEKFKTQSHALLNDMDWLYSPIQRTFTLDYNTVIKDSNGIIPNNEFIDYSNLTKVNKVYTVVAQGAGAKHIVEQPYCVEGVEGQIYEINNGSLKIKDVICYDTVSGTWNTLSNTYNDATINIVSNTIIVKNNKVINVDELEKGDKLRILTNEDLINKYTTQGIREVDGYIILVER